MKKLMQKLDPIAKNPVLTPVLCALMGVCVGVLSMWFACVDNRTAMFISYFTHPLSPCSTSCRWFSCPCCSISSSAGPGFPTW